MIVDIAELYLVVSLVVVSLDNSPISAGLAFCFLLDDFSANGFAASPRLKLFRLLSSMLKDRVLYCGGKARAGSTLLLDGRIDIESVEPRRLLDLDLEVIRVRRSFISAA